MIDTSRLAGIVTKVLPDLDTFLAWGRGPDALRVTPRNIRRPEDAADIVVDRLCVQNLAAKLMHLRGRRVGLLVKGCDSRTVVQLLQEKIIKRESLVILGVPCDGVVDLKKIRRITGLTHADQVDFDGGRVRLVSAGRTAEAALDDVLADKCLICRFPNPVIYDHLLGEPVAPRIQGPVADPRLKFMEDMSLAERFAFWKREMSRCIRCYACRNACPLCFCRDVCLADSRDPHWLSQETGVREKWMFQLIHATHLTGRCTECGECERSCPMDIPVLTFKKHLNAIIRELFDYEAGLDPKATPPLLTFQVDEDHIRER